MPLPPLLAAARALPLQVLARGSSLGWTCSSNNCSSFPLGFVGQVGCVGEVWEGQGAESWRTGSGEGWKSGLTWSIQGQ